MKNSAIAIVGMACRFPGARNAEEFWANLRAGREAIRQLSDPELLAAGASREELANPDYVRAAAILDDVDKLDAPFFGFSPRDASIMDPQHRHFLECAWEALEHAGHIPEGFAGSIGVFAGSGMNAYLIHNLLANRALAESAGLFLLKQTGNDKDVLATRVSYQLNLRGPSLSVQTACSTSLVAVHLACQSLLHGECDMALAGGVTIEIPHGRGYLYREGEILSRDGHCRAFDAQSSGTVFSSGAGIVVVRRLEDALADRDTIHAVILGSAINNDGARKIGYLAPSVEGQAEVVAEALEISGISGAEISYVETHGTGTAVGDPIEIKALTQAFRRSTQRTGYCAIGSLKSNLGHMDAAAGIGGLIKTVLALEHRELPASLHFRAPNPLIRFEETPFFVNAALREWQSDGPRRAGVTSLGIGGTNAHVVLQEAPAAESSPSAKPFQILALSAKTESALARAADNLAGHLDRHSKEHFADIAFTLQTGRKQFAGRQAVIATDSADAAAALRSGDTKRVFRGMAPRLDPSVIFLFSGQGSQYVRMGADVYASEPVFRAALDRCAEILRAHLDLDLRSLLYPPESDAASAAARLNQTAFAQPALFAIEYALAQFWLACGVEPRAMLGHSIGEYVAACLAGVFSLEDGLAITALRGRLMQQMQPGAMLAVPLAPDEIALGSLLSLAAINGPRQCVVSGPIEAIEALEEQHAAREIACRRLHTSHAFHSAMMEPMLDEFREDLRRLALHPPRIPCLSNLTGRWITPEEATNPDYWTRHVRETVRFSENLAEVFRFGTRPQSECILLEVGPGQALASLARQHPERAQAKIFSSLRHPQERVADGQFLLGTLAQMWVAGQHVQWETLHAGEMRRRAPLPTYPFEHQRYWISPDPPVARVAGQAPISAAEDAATAPRAQSGSPAPANAQDEIGSWFQRRIWLRKEAPQPAAPAHTANWLVFDDETGIGKELIAQLARDGQRAIRVIPERHYSQRGSAEYTIRPDVRADYDSLLADLEKRGETPQKIVHLWPARAAANSSGFEGQSHLHRAKRHHNGSDRRLDSELAFCFYSLLFLAQAIGDRDWTVCEIGVASRGLHAIAEESAAGREPHPNPAQAVLLGPVRVIPKELPGISCRNIDVEPSAPTQDSARLLLAEMSSGSGDSVVAYRANGRWVESFGPVAAEHPITTPAGLAKALPARGGLREHGVYFLTGGLGGIGLVIAEHLARECKAKLVLASRSSAPAVATAGGNGGGEPARRLKEKLAAIESTGGEVLIVQADVTKRDQLRRGLREARQRFGAIHGVIHAAGVLEDSPLQLKSRESAARVLAPKVQGTLLLEEELREVPLDFFALFSSVSSLAPPPGQVDYAAANAFLDAVTQSHRDLPVISINWGLWQDVGMGARAFDTHPLLARRVSETLAETTFAARLSCEEHWVLGEHILRSAAGARAELGLLPGTGYLEMAAAAFRRAGPGSNASGSADRVRRDAGLEFNDVFFLSPLACEKGSATEIRVRLRREGAATRFSVLSRSSDWVENASGLISRSEKSPPVTCDIAAIRARCAARILRFDESNRTRQERFFAFGPRWRSLRSLELGEGEALARIELPEQFAGDMLQYLLHPALLDMATGSALYAIEGYESFGSVYLPLSYKRFLLYEKLPPKFFSHIRARRSAAENPIATFDITLLDPSGRVLGEIEEFALRRLSGPIAPAAAPGSAQTAVAENAVAESTGGESAKDEPGGSRAIPPHLGARAFIRAISAEVHAQVIISPQPLPVSGQFAAAQEPSSAKPPSGEVEQVLAGWWQELLGLERVGLDDDFFDLGGHSLIAVRLFSKIKKMYRLDLGLSTLFEARTIRQLTKLIRQVGTPAAAAVRSWSALVPIQKEGSRPPLFMISGLGGNVLNFQRLASLVGAEQPVYALQPQGLDGRRPFLTRVEDMAAFYVREIKTLQSAGPYYLAGYSFGGFVAFEMAQQLRAAEESVAFIGLFDTIEWDYLERIKHSLRPAERLALYKARLDHIFFEADGWAYLRSRLRKYSSNGIYRLWKWLGSSVPQRIGTIEDINSFAAAIYKPKAYPGTLTIFRSMKREILDGSDEFLGWGGLAAGGIEVHDVPGTHHDMTREPNVRILAAKVRQCLAQAALAAQTAAAAQPVKAPRQEPRSATLSA